MVARHGPMVLGVCRRMVRDEHMAADAYQAVFLILARKARAIRVVDSLGRWLYGVSVRVAGRARAIAARERRQAMSFGRRDGVAADDPSEACERDELRAVIDEEISRLPSRYRLPLVLCYLEGMTHEQAARRLRSPVGTIESRLHRARARLRTSLTRRGLAPGSGIVAGMRALTAPADVPPELAAATTASAVRVATGGALAKVVSAAAETLVTDTMRSMLMIKGWWAGVAVVVIGLSALAAGGLAARGC